MQGGKQTDTKFSRLINEVLDLHHGYLHLRNNRMHKSDICTFNVRLCE